MIFNPFEYIPSGDRAISIEVGDEISIEINEKIKQLTKLLDEKAIEGVVEAIPAYKSLLVIYDPLRTSYGTLIEALRRVEKQLGKQKNSEIEIVHVPTLYGGAFGEDLNFVAQANHLTCEEVIKIHSGQDYLVYMLGFTPGFPYLGGMSEAIATDRRKNPRTKILKGSVY